MLKRAIFGAIYVAVIVSGILCGKYAFLALQFLLTILAVNEFLCMTNHTNLLTRIIDCVGAAFLAFILWWSDGYSVVSGILSLAYFACYPALRFIVQLWCKKDNALQSLSLSMMSQLYIALPIALMSIIYAANPCLLLLLFVLVWVNDTFAYLSGVTFGRHKLWERISPKKTWEGLLGGIVMTILVAFGCGFIPNVEFGLTPCVLAVLGLIVSVVGTLGDLVESLIKRTVGVKDSGNIIPGHGGILDRIDSILLVIPVTFFFLGLIDALF